MKFTDVNPFSKNEQSKINKSLLSTVKKGDFILGKNVEKFEKKNKNMKTLSPRPLGDFLGSTVAKQNSRNAFRNQTHVGLITFTS